NERTNTMFETFEMVYRMGLNYLKNDKPQWLKSGIKLLNRHNDRSETRAFNQLSVLFTINDLCEEYRDIFSEKLEMFCQKFNTNIMNFSKYLNEYKADLQEFKKDFGPDK